MHVTDLMAKVRLKVITQIKTLGDALGMVWLQVVSSEKGFEDMSNFESVILLWLQ